MFRHSFSSTGRKVEGKKASKADSRFERGTWLGKMYETDLHLVGTKNGVYSVRTIKRLPGDQQADVELMKEFRGVP